MNYEAVVIGSGVSGMSAAVALAKHGMSVLVLEQHRRPGGLMQTFEREGCLFPTGIHSVGSLDPGQVLWRYLKYLGILDRVCPVRMDADGFHEYRFGDFGFRMPMGQAAFRQRLTDMFPGDRTGIDTFFADMRDTVRRFPLYSLQSDGEESHTRQAQMDHAPSEHSPSVQSYVDHLTANAKLKMILTGINPLYGMVPAECPLYVHFLVLDSFLNSAWRFDESRSSGISGAFEDQLTAFGGDIRCNSCVTAVESKHGAVCAVHLADGEVIPTERVIYTGHPGYLGRLSHDRALRPAYRQRLAELPDTPGICGVAIEWESSECPLNLCDRFIYASGNVHAQYEGRQSGAIPHFVFVTATPRPHRGMHCVQALCISGDEEWAPWADTQTGKRPPLYAERKLALAEQLLAVLKATWPSAASGIRVSDTFTPLTFRDHTMTPFGSAYGIKKSVSWSARLSTVTRLRGLFLAGQSVVLSGVVGSIISSIEACGSILGRRYLMERIVSETE